MALALIMWTNYFTGSVNVGSPDVAFNVGAGITSDNPDCTGSFVDEHTMSISWDAFPGETCQLDFAFSETASETTVNMRLQDITMPTDLNATTPNCGLTINAGGSATPGAAMTLEVDSGAAFGQTITFTADTYGIQFVEEGAYVAGSCPAA